FFFFFSSRRRHTRSKRDWSSDVCSSDLGDPALEIINGHPFNFTVNHFGIRLVRFQCRHHITEIYLGGQTGKIIFFINSMNLLTRSEERRVGKEWRARRGGWQEQTKA